MDREVHKPGQGTLVSGELGSTFALMSLAWFLPALWPPFSTCWSVAGPFLDPMPLPLTEVYFLYIQSGPQVTELGQLYNLQASVPGENTGSLVQNLLRISRCKSRALNQGRTLLSAGVCATAQVHLQEAGSDLNISAILLVLACLIYPW